MPLCVSYGSLGRGWLGVPDVSVDKERVPPPKLKKQPWQWSSGTAPGEYGGPPLSLEPTRMWGKQRLHPLETKDEFIWNIDWRPYFDKEEVTDVSNGSVAEEESASSSGFISLTRVVEINRVDVDLSKELALTESTAAGSPNQQLGRSRSAFSKRQWRFAPTRKERKQWDRARKATVERLSIFWILQYSYSFLQETLRNDSDAVAIASASSKERERERYMQLKSGLQVLTAGIGAGGTVCAYVAYSPAVALSYGIGLAGSLAYVRMLGNSVDAFGSQGVNGAVRGAIGQPRLLVPVILTMLFNRWNEVVVLEFGMEQLQLIPMLVGFFTYKMATIAQAVQDSLPQSREES